MIHLSAATKSDARFLADLEAEVMKPHAAALRGPFRPAEISAFDLASTRLIHKADRRIGYVTMERNADHLRLSKLYLAPGALGAGHGAAVLALIRAEAEAAGLPLRLSVLAPNRRALAFYLREGLQISDTTPDRVFLHSPPDPVSA